MSLLILGIFLNFPVNLLLFVRGWEGLEMSMESFLKPVLCGFSKSIKTTPLAPLLLRQSGEERGKMVIFDLKLMC